MKQGILPNLMSIKYRNFLNLKSRFFRPIGLIEKQNSNFIFASKQAQQSLLGKEIVTFYQHESYGNIQFRKLNVFYTTLLMLFFSWCLSFTTQAQIALRGTSSAISSSASVTVNRPTGVVSGDILIANIGGYCDGCTQTSASSSGWTVIAGTNIERGRATLLYKIAGASEPANYAFAVTTGSTRTAAAIVAFSGVNTTTPFDVTPPTAWTTATNTTINNLPSITTVNAGAAVLAFGASGRITSTTNANFTSWTLTNPTLTEIIDIGHNSVTNTVAVGGAWGIRTTTGSTGAGGFTCTPNTNPRLMGGIMIALRPCATNTAGTASSNPTLCINTALTNITRTTTGATGIGTPTGLPAGVTAAWAANVLTISGTPTASGTFNYSIPLTGGCGAVNATGTITVTPNNTITRTSAVGTDAQTRCINTAITNITYATTTATGATFSGLPAGVNGNWASNVATISGTPTASGTFNYTVTLTGGCSSVTANGTITVTPVNTFNLTSAAGTNAQSVCRNVAITNITYNTTGATGISNNGVAGANGLPPGVTAAWAANVLTISGSPTSVGTFNYSIPLTGGCGAVNATGTITVTPNYTSTGGSNPTLCINTALTNITINTTVATGIGTATGLPPGVTASWASNVLTISGTPTASGIFTYSIPLTGGCGNVSVTGTITVTAAPTVGATANFTTICSGGTINLTGTSNVSNIVVGQENFENTSNYTAVNGQTRTGTSASSDRPANVSFVTSPTTSYSANDETATITTQNFTGLTPGAAKFVTMRLAAFSIGSSSAGLDASDDVTVEISLNGGSTYSREIEVNGNNNCHWGFTSGTGVAATTYDGDNTATVFAPAGGGARTTDGFSTLQISLPTSATQVRVRVTMSNSSNSELWVIDDIIVSRGPTYSWTSAPAGFTSSLQNPTGVVVSGNTTYTLTVTNPSTGCSNSSSVSITANPNNTVGAASSTPTLCNNTALTAITHTTTGATSIGTATGLPSGVTAAFASNTITISGTPTASGTFNYSIPLTGCGAVNATGTITVTPNPTVNVGPGLAAICQGGVSAALGGSVNAPATSGTWTSSAGGTFSPSATTLNATWTPPAGYTGTATLTLTSSGGSCGTTSASKSITVNPLPANAGSITGSTNVCQGQVGELFSIAALANATSYSWSYTGTGFSASGTTASMFATFSPSATSGVLTVRGVNACGNGVASANFPITVNSAPAAAGVITGSTSLCQGQTGAPFSVAPVAGATSYVWSYTGTGFTASGNTASITADFSASATSGMLTVRGVNSCGNGVSSANYNITIAQLPGTPSAITGPSTVCRNQSGFTFNVPAIANATSYNWVYTGTGVTFSGNTSSVTATISNTATPGVIRVRGVNSCLNGAFSADFPLTVINSPTVSITSNYCGNPGFVILTASSGFSSYLWNTGATTSFINADIAGQYSVTVTNTAGCTASASVGIATELVTNGKFDLGNTGFTTSYSFVADVTGQTEMYPEGTYAVVPNANNVHDQFWGTGRTPGGGPFMVVNGSAALGQTVWSQNSIAVQPNTTYYFSAWGLSVYNGDNAVLRFSINGNQVGTIANLPNGYSSTAGPFNWVRFYGSWNSGFATTADLSIVNLNTILGGNDFGLDDISFGTLSPIGLAVSPGTSNGTAVCQGSELYLNANAVGGASPFTYVWSGPNGYTSNEMNPLVTSNANSTFAGIYTVTVTDGFGCSVSSNFTLTVNALPLDRTPVASATSVCMNGNANISIATSQTGVSYQLRNDADNSPVGDPVAGTGGTISFPVSALTSSTTYNVLATGNLSQCSVEMTNLVTISIATTPVLNITNQAVCSGSVNLTAAAVTAGSTGSGTLTYWTNSTATTPLASPANVTTSGVYFIRSAVGTCFDIEPVTVSINASPTATFSYPTTPYCSSEADPVAVMTGSSVAGVFSCAATGLVFSNTATGLIDLSASIPGTYTILNTVITAGACADPTATATIVITQAPLTEFSYNTGNDLCQVISAENPAPIFATGAAAGTFSSTFGLNFVSSSTGVIDLAGSTPGNYAVWNTRSAIGGCAAESDTVFVDINPYVFEGTVTTSVSDDVVCFGETIDLFSQTMAYNSVLLRERFNGTINNWVRANSSSGGTVANAAWTLRPNNYNYGGNHRSNDDTQFYMSNSEDQGGSLTLTTLRSPVLNTIGYTNLSLDFFHYFDANSGDSAQVQVSLNNVTWTTVAFYTSDQGDRTSFSNPVINLNAYIGQPTFYVRFRYRATNDRQWAIDNVSLTGNCTKYFYDWASAPAGFSSTLADPVNVAPPQNSFYIVNATNTFGCSNPSSPIPVTVNSLPILTSALNPPDVCGNEIFLYSPTATPSGTTIAWTRPVATGISNAPVTAPQLTNPNEILENTTNSNKSVIYNFSLDNNGCSQTIPVTVNVKPIPVINIGSDLSVCNGSPAQLNTTISNGLNVNTYTWSPAIGLSSTSIADPNATVPTASQNYSVTVQATNGCTNSSAFITVSNIGFGGASGLWLGTQNNQWNDCRNWADGKVPDATTNVTVNASALNNIIITGSQSCNNLFFQSNTNGSRTITIAANASLTVTDNVGLSKTSGTGTITLRVLNNASLTCNNLSVAGSSLGAGNAIIQKDVVNSTITLNGNLSMDPGSIFDMNDNNNGTQEGILSVKGNFVNNGAATDFNVGNALVILNGSSLQSITCPTNQDFGRVTLDNSSTAGVRLNNDISVSQQMNFINGVLDLNQKTLTLGTSTTNATISGSGNNSYILAWDGSDNGTVVHRVNNIGSTYLFPIGDLNEYTPIAVSLTSASLTGATLTGKLYGNSHPNIVSSTNYIGRYWSVEPNGISNPLYNVEYSYSSSDIFGSEAFLFPAKYNVGGWQSCLESSSNAMIGNGSVNTVTNTLSWSGITTFSDFTGIGNGTALPIELLSFTAEPIDKTVSLKWITASESNNSHFIIERSRNTNTIEEIARVEGAGYSNIIRNYQTLDEKPLDGISYYRLKQIDFDGQFSYSEWTPVNFSQVADIDIDYVNYETNAEKLFVQCINPQVDKLEFIVLSSSGQMVSSITNSGSTSNWSGFLALPNPSPGSYILMLTSNGKSAYKKFIIH